MDDIISGLMDGKFLISCILLLVMIIKVLVNYWNTTSLERLLMTDLQRFIGNTSNLVFPSLILAGFGALFIWLIGIETPKTNDTSNPNINEVVWGVFGVILLMSILLHAVLSWIGRVLSIKLEYYINLNDKQKWKIIRRSNKDTLLIENENKETKLIDNWIDKVFNSELNENSSINNFYKKKKSYSITEWILIVSSFALFTITTVYNENPWSLLSFTIGAVFLVAFVVIKANQKEYCKQSRTK